MKRLHTGAYIEEAAPYRLLAVYSLHVHSSQEQSGEGKWERERGKGRRKKEERGGGSGKRKEERGPCCAVPFFVQLRRAPQAKIFWAYQTSLLWFPVHWL
jgi:hypothetical protein